MQQGQRAQQPYQGSGVYCQGCLEEAYQQAGLPYTWLPSLEDEPCPRHIHDPRRRLSQESHQPSVSQKQALSPARSPQLAEGLALGHSLTELLSVETKPTSPIPIAGQVTPSEPKRNPIHQAAVDFPVTGELNQARLRQPMAPVGPARSGVCPRCAGSGVREIGQQRKRCWYCGGRGQISLERASKAQETAEQTASVEQHPISYPPSTQTQSTELPDLKRPLQVSERAGTNSEVESLLAGEQAGSMRKSPTDSAWEEGLSFEQKLALEHACHAMRDNMLHLGKELQEAEQTLRQVVGHARMGTRKLRLLVALQRMQGMMEDLKYLASDLLPEE